MEPSEKDTDPVDLSEIKLTDGYLNSQKTSSTGSASSTGSRAGAGFKLLVCLLCGVVFGVCVEKGRVFEPKTIRSQMVMENFIMLKMFLAAVSTGQIIFALLSVIPATKDIFRDVLSQYVSCFSDKSLITSAIGAFVLGIGMTLSGACPGMVLAQVGTWVPNAIFTLLGCLVGALTYGMVAHHIVKLTKPKKCIQKQTADKFLNWPFIALALPMAILMAVAVVLLEYFWDYEKDLKMLGRDLPPYDNVVTAVAWRPSVTGAFIGLIQLPLCLVVHDSMGGSSSYCTVVSQWVVTDRLQRWFPYLASRRCGLANWWQVVYVCGAILGAALSALSSDTLATSVGANLQTAFFGGVLMLWGARFSAGCTSGHGLSGMGMLTWYSFIAVPFMFGGGIALGFTMRATGALDDYVTETLAT